MHRSLDQYLNVIFLFVPLFEVTSNWEILVDTEAILSSPIIYHVDNELLQKVLNIKYS
jgi:hypothetical protein